MLAPVVLFGFASTACGGTSAPPTVATLYPNGAPGVSPDELDRAFQEVYAHFENAFDSALYENATRTIRKGLGRYKATNAYRAHDLYPTTPHCDKGVAVAPAATHVSGISPGGVVGRVFGFDFGKDLLDLSEQANGPASAGLIAPMALASQALSAGMGLVQSSIASMLHVVPPLVPPPLWNNQPLTCAPMASGHNCFGAVTYPITMPDLMLADVSTCVQLSCWGHAGLKRARLHSGDRLNAGRLRCRAPAIAHAWPSMLCVLLSRFTGSRSHTPARSGKRATTCTELAFHHI